MIIPNPGLCPPEIRESLRAYVNDGLEPGSFTQACLRNDLNDASMRAHPTIAHAIVHVMAFMRAALPGNCWGSPAAYETWLREKREGKHAHVSLEAVSDLQPKD